MGLPLLSIFRFSRTARLLEMPAQDQSFQCDQDLVRLQTLNCITLGHEHLRVFALRVISVFICARFVLPSCDGVASFEPRKDAKSRSTRAARASAFRKLPHSFNQIPILIPREPVDCCLDLQLVSSCYRYHSC